MFEDIYNTQAIADALKAVLPRNTPAQREDNRAVYAMIQQFERTAWDAGLFEQAYQMVIALGMEIETAHPADGLWTFAVRPPTYARAVIAYLLGYYTGLMVQRGHEMEFADDQIPGFYTVKQAADYLGVSVPTIKHHVHNTGRLAYQLWNGRVAIPQQTLDDFKADPPKRGNPTSAPRNTKKKQPS
ncbi:MAG: helix-turn-helix domain-containing protein [Anaerolineae bacterium]|nr:helix-turn-helix domain-containing protein [Anaerolineae bacterium]